MLDELLAIVDLEDFQRNGSLRLTQIEGTDDSTTLYLEMVGMESFNVQPRWQLVCSGVRDDCLSLGYSYSLQLSNNHVLLWPHTSRTTSLYFHGQCENPSSVVGALYERHWELAGIWIPFYKFLNTRLHMTKLIAGGAGMLADGPEPLVLAYEEVMGQFGFATSHLEPKVQLYWNGEAWVEEKTELWALMLDESYVVAENFVANTA